MATENRYFPFRLILSTIIVVAWLCWFIATSISHHKLTQREQELNAVTAQLANTTSRMLADQLELRKSINQLKEIQSGPVPKIQPVSFAKLTLKQEGQKVTFGSVGDMVTINLPPNVKAILTQNQQVLSLNSKTSDYELQIFCEEKPIFWHVHLLEKGQDFPLALPIEDPSSELEKILVHYFNKPDA
jgi:type II secretory pathway pseudopilin PulG